MQRLTVKQRAFVAAVMAGCSNARAAEVAGYAGTTGDKGSLKVTGHKVAHSPVVMAELERLRRPIEFKHTLTRDKLLIAELHDRQAGWDRLNRNNQNVALADNGVLHFGSPVVCPAPKWRGGWVIWRRGLKSRGLAQRVTANLRNTAVQRRPIRVFAKRV